ncbi:hypothetical protein [Paracoccus sp. (in: a-proteobacteria)]|uniref:hypothetical protein n=1 Tax=Paracoccus sp. TaxID=267 RepID=UPI00396C8605
MIRLSLLAVLAPVLMVSACGVDGAPRRPVEKPVQQQMGVTLSGDARIGVSAEL